MAKQVIGIGTNPNDGNGDPLRTAFTKVNSNFTELYNIAASPYTLPTASGNILGGVKIGNNISIFNGVISVASQVQPDWEATSGLGQILNRPNDNELTNDVFTVSLNSQGVLQVPGNLQLTDQKQILSVNANVNGGTGGTGIVGWFNHPDPEFSDGTNTKAWGIDAPGDIVIKNIGNSGGSRYWKFGREGNFHIPASSDIVKSDGQSYLDYNNIANKPFRIVDTVPSTKEGVSGDRKGDMVLTSTHMYVCIETYSDGVATIWKRIILDTDEWSV